MPRKLGEYLVFGVADDRNLRIVRTEGSDLVVDDRGERYAYRTREGVVHADGPSSGRARNRAELRRVLGRGQ